MSEPEVADVSEPEVADTSEPEVADTGAPEVADMSERQELAGISRPARGSGRLWAPAAREALWGSFSSKLATIFLLALVLGAVFASTLSGHDPNAQGVANTFAEPTADHWLGTDDLGRDVLSRMLHGSYQSLRATSLASAIALAIGVPLGLIGGLGGRVADELVMRVVDAVLAFPAILLAMTVIAILGGGLTNAMIAVGIVFSPIIARLLRAQVLHVKSLAYVEAATTFGVKRRKLIVRHLLPNCIQPVIVQTALLLALGLLAEASLSFLGLGIAPPDPSWGSMLGRGYRYMHREPMLIVYPGIAIFLTALSFNVLGDGLRTALDPKSIRR